MPIMLDPSWLTLAAMLVAALAIGTVPFAILSRVHRGRLSEPTRELAIHVMARIAAIHGLIIALIFTETYGGLEALRNSVFQEATTIADVYHDASRAGEGRSQVRKAARAYAQSIISSEWPSLEQKRVLSEESWTAWHALRDAVLSLQAATPAEIAVRDRLVNSTWQLEDLRQTRSSNALAEVSPFLWALTVAGLLLVASLLFVYEATTLNTMMVAGFALYTGLAIFMIFDIVHPYDGMTRLSPTPFADILAQMGPEQGD